MRTNQNQNIKNNIMMIKFKVIYCQFDQFFVDQTFRRAIKGDPTY